MKHRIIKDDSGYSWVDPEDEVLQVYDTRIYGGREFPPEWFTIADIRHKKRLVSPVHGYFPKHPLAKLTLDKAIELGYSFPVESYQGTRQDAEEMGYAFDINNIPYKTKKKV